MPYEKQPWNQYDKSKTIEQNIQNDAVVTPAKMNHIEEGFSVIEDDFTTSLVNQKEIIDADVTARDLIINGKIASNKEDAENKIKTVDDKVAVVTKSVSDNKTANDQENSIQDSKIKVIEDTYKVQSTNKLINSNFDDVTGWLTNGVARTILNNELIITPTSINGFRGVYQNIPLTANHIIYFSFDYFVKYDNKITIGIAGVGSETFTPTANKWTRKSINAVSLATNSFVMYHDFSTRYMIGDNFTVRKAITLDLTETFGAGNEPTQTQMDRLLTQFPNSWFDGTKNLFLARWALAEMRRLDNEKANIKQEAWLVPALLNGGTPNETTPVLFRKNSMGRVEMNGRFKPATAGSLAMTFPVGYRSSRSERKIVPTNLVQVFAVILIGTTGSVYLEYPTTSIEWIDVSGVSFTTD